MCFQNIGWSGLWWHVCDILGACVGKVVAWPFRSDFLGELCWTFISVGSWSGKEDIREPPGGDNGSHKGKTHSEAVERFDEAACRDSGGRG